MKTVAQKLAANYKAACINSYSFVVSNANTCSLVLGSILLVGGVAELATAQATPFSTPAYNDSLVRNSVGNLFCLIEGAFGALIMVVAGLGAIVAAAMGAYRAAVGMLVVAVGAFILRALVSLFFGTNFTGAGGACGGAGGGTVLG